jgi:hypothetical protein
VIAVVYGAQSVRFGIEAASLRRSADVEALSKFERSVAEIGASLSDIPEQVREKTAYIVAAILATAAMPRDRGEPDTPAPTANAAAPPPYVTAARENMAAEVLRQRLAGRTHEQATRYAADNFARPENEISEAWNTNQIAAFDMVFDEVRRRSWELTEEARRCFREIFPSGIKRVKKTRGGLGETIAAIREEFIIEKFQRRIENGTKLNDREDEAEALLDEIKGAIRGKFISERFHQRIEAGLDDREDETRSLLDDDLDSDTSEKLYSQAKLPTIKTIMDVIDEPYSDYFSKSIKLTEIQKKNFRKAVKIYRNAVSDLGLYLDLFRDYA